MIDKHKVNIFYTAPTAIRALMREGDEPVKKTSRASLRLLGSVGEPINPEAWQWYHRVVGDGRCPIVDTWWQTETGGILISPLPGATDLKPGSATMPFFGIVPQIVDADGKVLEGAVSGNLCIAQSWPGQMRTRLWRSSALYRHLFQDLSGQYFTGDGCRRDEDGYYWITGRVDDVINVSGHRLGTAEVESALVGNSQGGGSRRGRLSPRHQGPGHLCLCHPEAGRHAQRCAERGTEAIGGEEIGPIAKPDVIQLAPGLPKTRSGKIMRRILRKIAEGDTNSLGDISTLADPSVVEDLVRTPKDDSSRHA